MCTLAIFKFSQAQKPLYPSELSHAQPGKCVIFQLSNIHYINGQFQDI